MLAAVMLATVMLAAAQPRRMQVDGSVGRGDRRSIAACVAACVAVGPTIANDLRLNAVEKSERAQQNTCRLAKTRQLDDGVAHQR